MNAITLRNVPPEIQIAIRSRARQKKISVNKAVIELLRERTGILEEKTPAVHDDLDGLAGRWSKAEANEFGKAAGALRRIDPELWR